MTDTTLITGATGGLGQAFARREASLGHRLALTGRRTDVLDQLAGEIRRRYGVEVDTFALDLADHDARQHLIDRLAERELTVRTLINNAGFASIADTRDTDADRLLGQVEVNCAALTHLTRAVLPAMLDAHRGTIINIASTAAFQPIPGMAVYAATKSFVLSLSQALWDEVRRDGVRVLAVCPGPTETGFFEAAGASTAMSSRRTPDDVVASAYRALDQGRPVVIDGRLNAATARLARLTPLRVVLPLAKAVLRH